LFKGRGDGTSKTFCQRWAPKDLRGEAHRPHEQNVTKNEPGTWVPELMYVG